MADVVTFVDSFDQFPPPFCGVKYARVVGTAGAYDAIPGPYHGSAARFAGTDRWLGPALRNSRGAVYVGDNPFWDSGIWTANVRLGTSGWSGEVALLAPSYYDQEAEAVIDFPHHWLTVDGAGEVRIVSWAPPPEHNYPEIQVLASSGPGVWPLGEWVGVEYRTLIRGDTPSPTGVCELRLDEALVFSATGLATIDRQRAVVRARYFRFGNIGTLPGDPGGFPEAMYDNGVEVDVDDVCERAESALGGPLVPWRGTHRVVARFATGPGDRTELLVVGHPAGENWRAVGDVPASDAPPIADLDESYVEKQPDVVTPDGTLQVDRYAMQPLPGFAEGEAGATLFVWGVGRHALNPPLPPAGPENMVTVQWLDALGGHHAQGFNSGREYKDYCLRVPAANCTTLTNAQLVGYQAGFGDDFPPAAALEQEFWGTQICAELWYRPEALPPGPGGQRWWVTWLP